MPTPREEIARAIVRWEGLYSDHPNDQGNYIGSRLVGTMRGVTGETLAHHRGIPPEAVTAEMVKSVTLDEAAEIGVRHFYEGVLGINTLPWGPTTAILLDWAWGSFAWSVKAVQRLIGAHPDGVVGPETRAAYRKWIAAKGWEATTREITEARRRYYLAISEPGTPNAVFREGWLNRCKWQSMDNPEWWATWRTELPPLPDDTFVPGEAKPAAVPMPVKPASKSRTARAAAGAAAGGVITAADKATDGGVTEIVTTTTTKLLSFSGLGGALLWIAVGVTIAGAGYAVYRVIQDRRAPA